MDDHHEAGNGRSGSKRQRKPTAAMLEMQETEKQLDAADAAAEADATAEEQLDARDDDETPAPAEKEKKKRARKVKEPKAEPGAAAADGATPAAGYAAVGEHGEFVSLVPPGDGDATPAAAAPGTGDSGGRSSKKNKPGKREELMARIALLETEEEKQAALAADKKKHGNRMKPEQRAALEALYQSDQHPSEEKKTALRDSSGLGRQQVSDWLSYRRSRDRKKAEAAAMRGETVAVPPPAKIKGGRSSNKAKAAAAAAAEAESTEPAQTMTQQLAAAIAGHPDSLVPGAESMVIDQGDLLAAMVAAEGAAPEEGGEGHPQ